MLDGLVSRRAAAQTTLDSLRQLSPYWHASAVTKAAGLPQLAVSPLPDGDREIRVWIGTGMGSPEYLFRVVANFAEPVAGSVIFYWPATVGDTTRGETFDDLMRYNLAGRCEDFRRTDSIGVCSARFLKRPAWNEILTRVEAEQVWMLPDESTLPRGPMMLDGWSMAVELRRGSAYRVFEYSNPDQRNDVPEAQHANAVADAVKDLLDLLPSSDVEKEYRGRLRSGPSLSEFQACGNTETWGIQGNLGKYSSWSNRARADTLLTGVRSQLVTVRGSLAPEWLAKRWGSEYVRVLQVSDVLSAKPWTPKACR